MECTYFNTIFFEKILYARRMNFWRFCRIKPSQGGFAKKLIKTGRQIKKAHLFTDELFKALNLPLSFV